RDPGPVRGGGDARQPRPARMRRHCARGPARRRHVVPPARRSLRQRGAGRAGDAAAARSGGRLPGLRGVAMTVTLPRAPAWGRRAGAVWPPREDFRGLIEGGNLIPLARDILPDLAPPVSPSLNIHPPPP